MVWWIRFETKTSKVMRSNPAHQLFFFIFQLENILRPNLNFSTSCGRLTDFKSFSEVIISEFYMAWRKNFTKRLSPYVQTVSTYVQTSLKHDFLENLNYYIMYMYDFEMHFHCIFELNFFRPRVKTFKVILKISSSLLVLIDKEAYIFKSNNFKNKRHRLNRNSFYFCRIFILLN